METQKLISLAIEGLELRRQSIDQEIRELENMMQPESGRAAPKVVAKQATTAAEPRSKRGPRSKKSAWSPERRKQQSDAIKLAWERRRQRAQQSFRHRQPAA